MPVKMLMHIKAKEFCCGCTLRTGCLILFWTYLVIESISSLIYLYQLSFSNKYNAYLYVNYYSENKSVSEESEFRFLTIRSLYFLITSIAGMIFCILGIFGIGKKIPKYLTLSLYYFGYKATYCVACIFLILVSPRKFWKYVMNFPHILSDIEELIFTCVALELFTIIFELYFWIIVKSCRDSMLRNLYSGDSTRDTSTH